MYRLIYTANDREPKIWVLARTLTPDQQQKKLDYEMSFLIGSNYTRVTIQDFHRASAIIMGRASDKTCIFLV